MALNMTYLSILCLFTYVSLVLEISEYDMKTEKATVLHGVILKVCNLKSHEYNNRK